MTAKILKLSGSLTILVSILGGILGSFDYALKIGGLALPMMSWPSALLSLIFGGIVYGFGVVAEKLASNSKNSSTKLEENKLALNDLSFIPKAIKRTRSRSLMLGVFSTVFAILLVLLTLFSNDEKTTTSMNVILLVIAVLCLVMGVLGFNKFIKHLKIEESDTYKLIMFEPRTVSTLKVHIVKSKLNTSINANLLVGKKIKASLTVSETELQLLKQYLTSYNADLGFEKTEQRV